MGEKTYFSPTRNKDLLVAIYRSDSKHGCSSSAQQRLHLGSQIREHSDGIVGEREIVKPRTVAKVQVEGKPNPSIYRGLPGFLAYPRRSSDPESTAYEDRIAPKPR